MMKKALCALLACLLLPALSLAEPGRAYETFEAAYAENIEFLNANTDRHMLPYTPERDYDSDGSVVHRIQMGALDVAIRLENESIASLSITLTAPEDMAYGDREYNDFTVSGFQCYAVMMAMSEAALPYALVESVNQALAASESFQTNVGDYRLSATREGGAVTLLFENELLMDSDPLLSDDSDDDSGEDSLAG